jgi:hypothetical protein
MLLPRRSPIQVPDEVDLFNLPNASNRIITLRSSQPLTEMSIRNLPGGKKRPACKADELVAVCEPNVWKCGTLNLPTLKASTACTGITLPLSYICIYNFHYRPEARFVKFVGNPLLCSLIANKNIYGFVDIFMIWRHVRWKLSQLSFSQRLKV